MGYTPRAETLTGADLTGTSGTASRTYELTNDDAILAQMQVMRASAILQSGVDFSFDASTNTVTFISLVWDDQAIAIDYLTETTTLALDYIAKQFNVTGEDCSGSDGATSRVFRFLRSGVLSEQMQVTKSSAILQNGTDYTYSKSTRAITFITAVADSEPIEIDFYVQSGTYATTLQVSQYSGIGVAVETETLGTGDASTASFDVDNANIIESSFTLFAGTGNNLQVLVEGTHYQINIEDGRVFLTDAGVTLLATNILYISYTYSPKHSNAVLDNYLLSAVKEAEKLTGNYWGTDKTSIQYFDGYDSGYPQTDRPFGEQIDPAPEFEVDNQGITSITSVEYLDRTGDVDSEVDSDYISFDDFGRVILNGSSVPNGKRNVKITYIHGYDTVPEQIQELVSLIAGLKALVNISGGSYKDVSTYQLGRLNFSRGQIYVNIESSINKVKSRIDTIIDDVGPRYAVA